MYWVIFTWDSQKQKLFPYIHPCCCLTALLTATLYCHNTLNFLSDLIFLPYFLALSLLWRLLPVHPLSKPNDMQPECQVNHIAHHLEMWQSKILCQKSIRRSLAWWLLLSKRELARSIILIQDEEDCVFEETWDNFTPPCLPLVWIILGLQKHHAEALKAGSILLTWLGISTPVKDTFRDTPCLHKKVTIYLHRFEAHSRGHGKQ